MITNSSHVLPPSYGTCEHRHHGHFQVLDKSIYDDKYELDVANELRNDNINIFTDAIFDNNKK